MVRFSLLVLVLSSVSFAQLREPLQRRPIEQLESLKKVRMLEAVKLNEETGIKLITRYSKNREAIWELEQERRKVMDKLTTQLQANVSETEFQKTFDDLRAVEKKITDVRLIYLNELQEILTPKQMAEYLVFERNFARDIREVARKIRIEKGEE